MNNETLFHSLHFYKKHTQFSSYLVAASRLCCTVKFLKTWGQSAELGPAFGFRASTPEDV
jgi:hypothetical protein